MTGTPGSGKSHSMAFQIRNRLRQGKNVISTVNINLDIVTKNGKIPIGHFLYIPIFELTTERLERYALENHVKGQESQTYVFIDECQLIFNTRDYANNDRKSWLVFFTSHRHYGYELFLITQNDRMIDRQIRALVEHEIKHRKINNFLWFLPVTIFVAIETWYGHAKNLKLHSEFILFRPSVAKMYDSYTLFDDLAEKYANLPDAKPSSEQIALSDDELVPEVVCAEVGVGGPTAVQATSGGLFGRVKNFFTSPLHTAELKGQKTE